MKHYTIKLLSLLSLFAFATTAYSLPSTGDSNYAVQVSQDGKEVIEYRALVWIDKGSMERYGGEAAFREKLDKMFMQTTEFFNGSPNRFNYYFRFVPAGIRVYDTEGDRSKVDSFKKQAFGKLDTERYDYVLFLALDALTNETCCGGGGESGQCVVIYHRTLKEQEERGDIFSRQPPVQGAYSDLAHEYGHIRGATDLYQYMIKAEDNPVSHVELVPPFCNMGTSFGVWSDYCYALFNYTARDKQMDRDLTKKIFPEKLRIHVVQNGKEIPGAQVKFYGTRAGGSHNKRDVYPEAYRTFQTDVRGTIEVTDLYKLYHPDYGAPGTPPKEPIDLFPYTYWFSFVVEASNGAAKGYVWLPDFVLQERYLRTGEKVHTVTLKLE